jgi:hypothetical protein
LTDAELDDLVMVVTISVKDNCHRLVELLNNQPAKSSTNRLQLSLTLMVSSFS